MMTGNELKQAGIELYGARGWVSALANATGVHRITVYKYINEQLPIPVTIERLVGLLLNEHRRGQKTRSLSPRRTR
jgi:hypothetical protein